METGGGGLGRAVMGTAVGTDGAAGQGTGNDCARERVKGGAGCAEDQHHRRRPQYA